MTTPVRPTAARCRSTCRVSVVMPVFNEAAILRELTDSVRAVLTEQRLRFEIVYVNDGSSDQSRDILDSLAGEDVRIKVLHLARNFGHQAAVHAGLDESTGDVVVLMDSDLQDDPRAMTAFLERWEDGFDVVYAQRFNRKESWPKRLLFYSFYRVLNAIAENPMPEDAGNFSLMDRSVVDALQRMPETERYLPGLRSWVGFRQTGVPVERLARHDDQPRVSLRGLFRLAKTAVFSFSSFPLTLFYVIAAVSGCVCLASVGFVLYHKAFTGLAIPGWASVIITASFFGALNALGISVLGEYVIRIYDQVRGRPIYIPRQLHCRSQEIPETSGETLHAVETLMQEIDKDLNLTGDAAGIRH
ncbi:MAG: glycosyltransferase family 2 protein [Fuerstiella sp.]